MKEEPEKEVDQDARLAMVLLRFLKNWEQADLAREARIAPSQVSVYERGKRTVPAEVLGRAADAAEFPRYLLEPVKRAIRSFRAAAGGRSRAERVLADEVFAELVELGRLAVDAVLRDSEPEETGGKAPSPEDREEAAELWSRLERRTPNQRRALVEEAEEFRSWTLCERVAAASADAAAGSPVQATELAGLALLIADLAPGEAAWRSRLQGYAWAHMSRARLACSDRAGAGEAYARARSLWEAGAAGDPGLLDDSALLRLEADLRRA